LRRGRSSLAGATYFLTICLEKGQRGLDAISIYSESKAALAQLNHEIGLICHGLVHLLIEMNGIASDLSSLVRLFKGRLSPALRKQRLSWQRGYFDRRLRDFDSKAVVLRYMLMNPYRKGLIEVEEEWPYWSCSDFAMVWLDDEDERNRPVPEWLGT